MIKLCVVFSILSVLPFFALTQEIPTGKYANGRDYFRFLPEQKVEYRFSDNACVPSDYRGTGSYVLMDGRIVITPLRPEGYPDSTVKRIPVTQSSRSVLVKVYGPSGFLKGVSVSVVDVNGRSLITYTSDETGVVVIKVPEGGVGLFVILIGYESLNIPDVSSRFNYELFMEKPASIESTKSYFNVFNGGLQYTFTNGIFSLNRMMYNCSDKSSTPEWFSYRIN